jgi:hypothetical protein
MADDTLAAVEAVNQSKENAEKYVTMPGTVNDYNLDTRAARVTLDDTSQVTAQNISGSQLGPNERVMVQFQPPRGVFVVGPTVASGDSWSFINGSPISNKTTIVINTWTTYGSITVNVPAHIQNSRNVSVAVYGTCWNDHIGGVATFSRCSINLGAGGGATTAGVCEVWSTAGDRHPMASQFFVNGVPGATITAYMDVYQSGGASGNNQWLDGYITVHACTFIG